MSSRQRGYTRRWEKARKIHLAKHPTCVQCEADGHPRTGNEVDHIVPHMGDPKIFWDEKNWQTLCKTHHSMKTAAERKHWAKVLLPILPHPIIPIELVCGPPGSGKTTYCINQATHTELIIDLDEIKFQVRKGPELLKRAIIRRNEIIASLAEPTKYTKAYLIVGAPRYADRAHWVKQLACKVTVLETAMDICADRLVVRDGDRAVVSALHKWYKEYVAGVGEEVIRCT